MLKKNNCQIDMFEYTIFEKLIAKDHLLVRIDFSLIYNMVEEQHSTIGEGQKIP